MDEEIRYLFPDDNSDIKLVFHQPSDEMKKSKKYQLAEKLCNEKFTINIRDLSDFHPNI